MNRHSQVWSAAAMAIVLLGVGAPGSMAASQLPVVLSGTMPGSGYVVTKLDYFGGGPVDLSIATAGCHGGCAFGGSLLGPDGSELSSIFVSSGVLGKQDCIMLRSTDVGIDRADCHPSSGQQMLFPGSGTIRFWDNIDTASGDPRGAWTLIVWIAYRPNEGAPTSWSLSFGPGVASILGVSTGDRAWYGSSQDFQGGTVVVASRAGAFASAHAGSHMDVNVESRLFGMMSTDSLGTESPAGGLTFHGPFGAQVCTCMLWDLAGPKTVGPGSYRLSLDRVAGGHQALTDLSIVVVDLKFPD